MTLKTYYNPVEVLFGIDSLKNISDMAMKFAENKEILIVSDKNLLDILGISEKMHEYLEKDGFNADIFEKE